jgi:hypothetical protein
LILNEFTICSTGSSHLGTAAWAQPNEVLTKAHKLHFVTHVSPQLTYLKRDYFTCLPDRKNIYKTPKTYNQMKASNARNSMFNPETRSMQVNLKSSMLIQSSRSFMLMEGKRFTNN